MNFKSWLSFINSLLAPLFSIVLLVLSSAPFMTYISIRLKIDHTPSFFIGIVHSAFYLGFLIGSAKAEKLIKRIGYIRSFAAFASIYSSTVLIQGMFIHPFAWIILRLLGGISISALYIVIESWLLIKGSAEIRGKILSFYMIALYASQSFGQLILQAIPFESLIPFLLAGILGTLSVFPVATTYTKSPEPHEDVPHKSFWEIVRLAPLGFWGCFSSGLILSSIYSFVPNFAQFYNIEAPLLMTVTIAGGFILQWPIGHFSDLFDRRKILTITSLCIIIPCLAIIFLTHFPIVIYIASFVLGGCCFTLYPLSITHVCDKIDPIYTTYATGILSVTYGVGSILGPLISPFFMEYISTSALYLYMASISLFLGLIGVYYKIKRPRRTPIQEKSEYIAIPPNAPIPSELDPRVQEEKNPEESE